MAVGQWPPLQSKKIASCQKWGPYMARRPFSNPIRAKEEGNGPPSADQGLSTAGPRVETRPSPPVPPFLLAQNLSPKDVAGSDITS